MLGRGRLQGTCAGGGYKAKKETKKDLVGSD